MNQQEQKLAEPLSLSEKQKTNAERIASLMARVSSRVTAALTDRAKIKHGRPDMHYSWVYIGKESQVEFKILGYRPVGDDPEVQTDWYDDEKKQHIRGDTILFQLPREEYEALEIINAQKALVDIEVPLQVFQRSAAETAHEHRTAVPTFTGRRG